jgi:hypothetical protein
MTSIRSTRPRPSLPGCTGIFTAGGFEVWLDRIVMPSRGLTFHQEIQDAVATRERLVLVVGPTAALSDYVRQEWQFALWFSFPNAGRQGGHPDPAARRLSLGPR